MAFQLSDAVNKDKVFLVKRSELEGRLDPSFNAAKKRNQIISIYPKIPMGKLCSSLTGGTPSKDNPDFWNGSIPWISPKDFRQFYLNDSVDHISEEAIHDSSTRLIPENSVVIVVRSGVLIHTIPVAVTLKPMTINQDIKALVFCDKVLPAFAAYYIHVFQQKILPLVTKHSTTVQSINTEQFEKLDLVVPPLNIQQNVIDRMNAAYSAKKQKEAQAQQLLDSIDSYLLHELGIELPAEEENNISQRMFVRKFSEVSGGRFDPEYFKEEYIQHERAICGGVFKPRKLSDFISSIAYGASVNNEYETSGIPLLRIKDLKPNEIDSEKTVFLPESMRKELGNAFVKCGNFLISRSGSLGVTAIVDEAHDGFAFGSFMIRFDIVENEVNSLFVSYILNSCLGKTYFKRNKIGAIQGNITIPVIQSILIPLPPLEKQNEIATHIQTIRDQAKQLRAEAAAGLENAKQEVEAMILGKDSNQ